MRYNFKSLIGNPIIVKSENIFRYIKINNEWYRILSTNDDPRFYPLNKEGSFK
jgi:hypothetical protein